jgi:hypothetical protein
MKCETLAGRRYLRPIKRRATLVQKRVDEIAASMLDVGQQTPILVRADGAGFVPVEVCTGWKPRRLGEKTIVASVWKRATTERRVMPPSSSWRDLECRYCARATPHRKLSQSEERSSTRRRQLPLRTATGILARGRDYHFSGGKISCTHT